ncbi:site-specific integrase [Lederbergia citrisecunda]|uniref:tyrosine-type recombinase/integrase n=1 Tax=Lederbergia citrisecunda TaxID=2833583 RepID=UPI003D2810F8
MVIEKSTKISFEEICSQLGVSENTLINFLNSNGDTDSTIQDLVTEDKTALFVIEQFLQHQKNLVNIGKRSPETWTTYNNFMKRVKSYLLINAPSLKICELNEVILNEIITHDNASNKKYSIRTINKYNAIMKSFVKFGFQNGHTNKNIGHKFTLEKAKLIPRYIKDDQIPKILEVVSTFSKPIRCRAIIIFFLLTGCRPGEVSNIKVREFSVVEDLIYINDAKGNKDRIIPMYPQLKEEILFYLQKSGMKNWDPFCDGYLFARDEGVVRQRKLPVRTLQYLVERIRKRIPELSKTTAHSFRHTFAVQSTKNGLPGHLLTLVLGHTKPETTKVYTTLHGDDLRNQIIGKFPFPFENLLNTLNED